jgi:hypothetical protein
MIHVYYEKDHVHVMPSGEPPIGEIEDKVFDLLTIFITAIDRNSTGNIAYYSNHDDMLISDKIIIQNYIEALNGYFGDLIIEHEEKTLNTFPGFLI